MYGTKIEITNKKRHNFIQVILRPIILVVLITFLLTNLPVVVESKDNSRAAIEDFTLLTYKPGEKKIPSWKLTGKRADQSSNQLTVYDFRLIINDPDSKKDKLLYNISGKQIKLTGSEKDLTALMPEDIRMRINQKDGRLEGTAGDARYHFSTRSISGSNLNLIQSSDEGDISLQGSRFTYTHAEEKLVLNHEFRATISNTKEGQLEVTGEKLTWSLQNKISMSGDLRTTLDSGWSVNSSEMNWNQEESILVTSGSSTAYKNDLSLQGESISYHQESEKIVVTEGKLRFDS